MRPLRPLLAATTILLLGACTDDATNDPLGPSGDPSVDAAESNGFEIGVMTRNLYVGADVDAVIAALASPSQDDDLPTLLGAINTLHQTDFAGRAAAFAAEIARARPHVVGLQEVSTIDLTLPPFGVEVHLDFLTVLLDELADAPQLGGRVFALGFPYVVAARVTNFEATPFPGVRLVDDDALLIDPERVTVQASTAQRFSANLGEVAPGVVLTRGWVSAAVAVGGGAYTVASTHLESGAAPGLDQLRALQATELVQALAGPGPVILMGDLNDVPGSPMHQVLVQAGFTDVWAALRPGTTGFTCCHLPDLSNPLEAFDHRIDYVFSRGAGRGSGIPSGQITRIGELPPDRIPGPDHPIWPSDHAGLVAWLGALPPSLP